jgi:predicted transcriptional regulator of viral defense system
MVENRRVGATGANGSELSAKVFHCFFHPRFCGGLRFFGVSNGSHRFDPCESSE